MSSHKTLPNNSFEIFCEGLVNLDIYYMKSTFIYSISDEFGVIRYIGKSNSPKNRLYKHLQEKSNHHKYNWLHSILKRGSFPIIEILDEVPIEDWPFYEKYWISQFKCWGFNLINLTEGGEGGCGYRHTEESKRKMRKTKLGSKLPKEQRKKISESVKLKAKENPLYNRGGGNSRIHLDKDSLYQKYIVENLSLNKCANFFKVSKKTVFTNITEYGFRKEKSFWINQVKSNPEKTILQFDKDGNFLSEWIGLKNITKKLNINSANIANCCRGVAKSAGGFIWKYKD